MPGLDPESAFREMATIDFDISLSQSSALNDKFQRALSTSSLAEVFTTSATTIQRKTEQNQAKNYRPEPQR
jgi:hypothetical protein